MNFRREEDSLGTVKVPDDRLYGAQTARALDNFDIGREIMPEELIISYLDIKEAAARVNERMGGLAPEKAEIIINSIEDLRKRDNPEKEFPLSIWQSGSGTQTNMNVNEVIANNASLMEGEKPGSHKPVHPNDDVNMSQSTNDTFPTVISLALLRLYRSRLKPALTSLIEELGRKAEDFKDIDKTGRTHMMDATPVTLGQEFAGYREQMERAFKAISAAREDLKIVPLGGTAVGTGLNAPENFAGEAAAEIEKITGIELTAADNKLAYQAAHDNFVRFSSALEGLAVALKKMGEDLRMMASGPRCGLQEIEIPAREPGSSIMPGKINPTQIEVITQVSVQVQANHRAVVLAGNGGQFELNTYRPVFVSNLFQSVRLLADSIDSFTEYCLAGIAPNRKKLRDDVENSLMLMTALAPEIGYDRAAEVADLAREKELSLAEAAAELGFMSRDEVREKLDPARLSRPHASQDEQD